MTGQEDFTVSYERASGEARTVTLSKGVSSVGTTPVEVPDRGSTAVTVMDLTGNVVAKGRVSDNGNYVLLPAGTGYLLASAGTLAGPFTPYPGVVIVNALPDEYTVDLFGDSGKVGVKAVAPTRAPDVKQAVRLAPGDTNYKPVIHLPDGTTVQAQSNVSLGWYHVIHKTYDNKITVSSLGWIEKPDLKADTKVVPKAVKKKKKK